MVIKYTIRITIRGFIPDKVSAKNFSAEVADRLIKSDKVEASMHLSMLINMRYRIKLTCTADETTLTLENNEHAKPYTHQVKYPRVKDKHSEETQSIPN